MRALVKVTIPYDEDIDRVMEVMTKACKKIRDSNDTILDGPNVVGVSELGDAGVSITIVAKTKPMNQWAVEREIRKAIKEAFDKENIKIAYPRIVVHGGKEQ